MRVRSFLLGGTVALACALPASAGNFNGWYIGLEGGGNWNSDNDASFATVPPLFAPVDVEFDTGWAALATMGYAFENSGWRVEGEFGYRHNDVDAIGGTSVNGELTSMSLMANVLYDFKLMDRLTLSVGAGAGAEHSTFDDGVIDQDEDYNFAYQGIAGLSYAVTPRMDLTLNYRYMRTDESSYHGAHLAHTDYYALDEGEKQTLTIGLRYDLYRDEAPMAQAPVAPPAPPMEAAPAAPRQFLVFFGFDKSNLTTEAEKVISEAAAAAKQDGAATVVVVGHADTSGSPEYNQRLSERRANVVRGALVAQGIDGGKITASGKGETELLVQTGDGVKEPQNRRATIDLN
ncbi:MAG: outer membrane beta-barrel protein [Alphaproteobacteria bacterium]|jgi:outer membrane protein OmpA-like peptidoglycan-associated protein|nr:outer membrane beta-barrel protein [Alphaproteobacteria bacterium]